LVVIQIITFLLIIFVGIPSQIIDYKHRKRKSYEHGNAWAYYTQLSKEGRWDGRFMMWSAYLFIYFILGIFGYMFYALTR
jgi:hypothetical protein